MRWQNVQEAKDAIWRAADESDTPLESRLCAKAVEAFPDSPELWAIYAQNLRWMGRAQESETAINKAYELGPDCAIVHAVRAGLATFNGFPDQALVSAQRALSLDGNDRWVFSYCADAFVAAGDTRASLDLVSKWCELYPDDVQAAFRRVPTLVAAGRNEEAEIWLQEAEQRFPDSTMLWRQRALLMMRQNLPEATGLYRRVVEKSPGSYMGWSQLAGALEFLGEYEEAEKAAAKALEICPCAVNAMEAMSRLCRDTGRAREAEEWRQRAAEAIPGLAAGRLMAPVSEAVRRRQWRRVLRIVQPVLSSPWPMTRQNGFVWKAKALLEMGRIKECESVLAELEDSGYDGPDRYELRGRIMLARWDIDGAEAMFSSGLRKYPDDGTLRGSLLKVLHRRSRCNEERAVVSEALLRPPQSPWGVSSLVTALLETNHLDEARQLRIMGQKRFPGVKDLRWLEVLEKLHGKRFLSAIVLSVKLLLGRR